MFQLQDADDLDNDIDELLQEFEDKTKRRIMHTVQFYWPLFRGSANKNHKF